MSEKIAYLGSCLASAFLVTLVFYILAARENYSQVDIYIGSVWTFVLALIISSPLIIPKVKKLLKSSKD